MYHQSISSSFSKACVTPQQTEHTLWNLYLTSASYMTLDKLLNTLSFSFDIQNNCTASL